jgi:hypothetical protein
MGHYRVQPHPGEHQRYCGEEGEQLSEYRVVQALLRNIAFERHHIPRRQIPVQTPHRAAKCLGIERSARPGGPEKNP